MTVGLTDFLMQKIDPGHHHVFGTRYTASKIDGSHSLVTVVEGSSLMVLD